MTPDLEAIRARQRQRKREHADDCPRQEYTAGDCGCVDKFWFEVILADIDALLAEVDSFGRFRGVHGAGFGVEDFYTVAKEYEARFRELAEEKSTLLAEVERLRHVARECECSDARRTICRHEAANAVEPLVVDLSRLMSPDAPLCPLLPEEHPYDAPCNLRHRGSK